MTRRLFPREANDAHMHGLAPPVPRVAPVARAGDPELFGRASRNGRRAWITTPVADSMKANLKHHVVSFPDCLLSFDYPADLTPSAAFIMQRMDSAVDYETITWRSPTVTDAFVSIYSDCRGGPLNKVMATLFVEMWLGAAPPHFEGDLSKPADLRRAYAERAAQTKNENADELLMEDVIDGRTWFYVRSANMYLTALNSRIFLTLRAASLTASVGSEKARDWIRRGTAVVLESIQIKPRTPAA